MGFSLKKSIKKLGKTVSKAAKATVKAPVKVVKSAGRAIDVTASKSAIRKGAKALDVSSGKNVIGKHLPKNVRTGIRIAAQTVAAPMVVPTAIVAKGTTAALAATGAKPLKKLDKAVGGVYRSKPMKQMRSNYTTQLKIGGAVGAAIVGGQVAPKIAALGGGLADKVSGTPPITATINKPPEVTKSESTIQQDNTGTAAAIAAAAAAAAFLL